MSVIGNTVLRDDEVAITDRLRHVYIIGQTGTGKSSLLRNLIVQDLDKGFALFDPHGDLAEEVLDLIPPHRINDVVYFNPADIEHPIGFNPLESIDPDKRSLVSQGIIHSFKTIWGDTWGEGRMQYVFSNCLLALMETESNFLHINRFLTDEIFRKRVLKKVKNPAVLFYWSVIFPRYKEHDQALITSPIENKVGQFTTDPMVRNIFGQKNKLNIKDILDKGQIFIANLSKGHIGHINSNLLGSLLVSQFEIAVMEREDRTPYFLYLDEFQNFTTDSFESMLSESRKYGLSLTLAHQYIDQLPFDLQRAVFGNVGNLISLRVGNKDADVLSHETGRPAERFIDLSKYHAIVKQLKGNEPVDTGEVILNAPIGKPHNRSANIVEQSRRRYGKDRQFVDKKIEEFYSES